MHRFRCNTGWKNLLCKKDTKGFLCRNALDKRDNNTFWVLVYVFVFQIEHEKY